MNNRGMEAFFAIATGMTLSRAAELLNLTQSTVSNRLKEFEEELGVILVNRQKGLKTIRLTPAGEQLLPIVAEWQKLKHRVDGIATKSPVYSLRVGAVDSVSNAILPGFYRALRKHSPPVHLKISTNDSLILYNKVKDREIDVAFVLQALSAPWVQVKTFYRESMLVVRHGGSGAVGGTVDAGELDSRHELRIEWGPEFQLWHDNLWDPLVSTEMRLDTLTLIGNLLEDEKQWAIVPESGRNFLSSRGMIFQKLRPAPPDRICYKIQHRFPLLSAVAPLEIMESMEPWHYRQRHPVG